MEDLALMSAKVKKAGIFLLGMLLASLFLPLTGKQIVIATFVYGCFEAAHFWWLMKKK